MVTFPTNILSKVKKIANLYLFQKLLEKTNIYVTYCFLKCDNMWSKKLLFTDFCLNYTDFAHATSYIMSYIEKKNGSKG